MLLCGLLAIGLILVFLLYCSGQCVCKDDSRITGLQCDTCKENKYNLTAGCLGKCCLSCCD